MQTVEGLLQTIGIGLVGQRERESPVARPWVRCFWLVGVVAVVVRLGVLLQVGVVVAELEEAGEIVSVNKMLLVAFSEFEKVLHYPNKVRLIVRFVKLPHHPRHLIDHLFRLLLR